jgi:hypothetical protein
VSSILQAIAGGIATELGTDGVKAAARGAAAAAGSVEHELDVVDGPRPAALWSAVNPHLEELAALSADQRAIVAVLLRQRDTELDRILEQLRSNQFQTYVQPYWFAAGDTRVMRQFPELPGGDGWTLDGFLAWTDPAAAADAVLTVAVDGVLQIPMRVVAARNGPTSQSIGLPVGSASALSFSFTPAPGAGGTANDRVAVLARFKRGG